MVQQPMHPAEPWITFSQFSLLKELLAQVCLLSTLAGHPGHLICQCEIAFYEELSSVKSIASTLIVFKNYSRTFLKRVQLFQQYSVHLPSITC
ncbi:hypothetical protein TNCV_3309221 [Trichonephila clavipes]|nr:hypothetical protein TNCV_3309221 [Trichonephila clavipes]